MVAKSEYNKVFANNLRRIMHERDKNGADMARFLGVGKSRVSSCRSVISTPHISITLTFPMPIYKNAADGLMLPRSKISTAMPSLIRSHQPTYSPFQRSKIHSNRILIPNKKAPQNAKYSVLRGILLPAAGVEPAQGRRVYVRIAESCQITFQTNKKRASQDFTPARLDYVKNVRAC